ncbi:nitrate- and nitrite sensing domain-containing protein [Streptomyces sp. SMC 277]|uniref:histidine kinase n=2 Tax=Streptomyces antimicrobicus TaxID=2883108 RepID=A0ABS8B1H4_9ACTN|nr:ATP-binding protein [Streptomyces antimicrobicus]MCB5178412.1 nitrate- and nitrite sensing domain-containing protein [Streptomyces antimicrobicus]
MVPVVSLLGLWAFATLSTAQDVARLSRAQQADSEIRTPIGRALAELQAERRAAVRYLADPGPDQAGGLQAQAGRTDAAVARLRLGDRHTVADAGDRPPAVAVRLRAFVSAAEALAATRTDVAERRATPDAAYDAYTKVVDAALAVGGALSAAGQADSGGLRSDGGGVGRVPLEFARAAELLAREDALLAFPGPRTADTLRKLTGTVEARRTLTEAAARDLPPAQAAAWQAVAKSAAYADLTAAEDRILAAGPTPATSNASGTTSNASSTSPSNATSPGNATSNPTTPGKDARGIPPTWEASYTSVANSLRAIENAAHAAALDRTSPLADAALSPAGAAVLLGLVAVAASLVISVRIGRGLVVELVSLRNSALEIAHRKLPAAMERLRAGQELDLPAEAPPGPPAEDEVGQVGEALATVHRAALAAAAERAELASGISGVFVNLARRSQVLVHRQLTLLDSMERRVDDPAELGDLFRLDHLTTRMRRHAESLIILSGAVPGRAWRMPVPLTNVVRAAVSEIEDYPRVEVHRLAEAAVVGAAVADLTHLLAELIENATQFSPPHTKVRVTGEPVGAGYVLEVEDRGLGMGPRTLADANRRIEQSEALDLFDSDRLGLFVVSRLSARHGVKVHLRTSPYGGTTAVVLLPTSLLQGAITAGRPPRRPEHEGERERAYAYEYEYGREREAEHEQGRDPEREREPGRQHTSAPAPHASAPHASAPHASAPHASAPTSPVPELPYDPAPRLVEPTGSSAPTRSPAEADKPQQRFEPSPEPARPGRTEPPRPAPVATLRPRAPLTRSAPPVPPAPPASPAPPPPEPHRAPTPASAPRATAPPPALAEVTELPRRVRQASLVPQLREAPAAPPVPGPAATAVGRSPEEARERMAAYRAGWARGAQQDSRRPGNEGEEG